MLSMPAEAGKPEVYGAGVSPIGMSTVTTPPFVQISPMNPSISQRGYCLRVAAESLLPAVLT